MTVDIVRTISDPNAKSESDLELENTISKTTSKEAFCPLAGTLVFENCESVKSMWLAVQIIMSGVAFFAWFFTNFHVSLLCHGIYSLEYT